MFGFFKNKNNINELIIDSLDDVTLSILNEEGKKPSWSIENKNRKMIVNHKKNVLEIEKNNDYIVPYLDKLDKIILTFNNIPIEKVTIKNSKNLKISRLFCDHVNELVIRNSDVIIETTRAIDHSLNLFDSKVKFLNLYAVNFNIESSFLSDVVFCEGAVNYLNIKTKNSLEVITRKQFYINNAFVSTENQGLIMGKLNVVHLFDSSYIHNGDLVVHGSPTENYILGKKQYHEIKPNYNVSRFKSNRAFDFHGDALSDIKNDMSLSRKGKFTYMKEEMKRVNKIFTNHEFNNYNRLLNIYPEHMGTEYNLKEYQKLLKLESDSKAEKIFNKYDETLSELSKAQENYAIKIMEETRQKCAKEKAEHDLAKIKSDLDKERVESEYQTIKLEEELKQESIHSSNNIKNKKVCRDEIRFLRFLNSPYPTDFIDAKNRDDFILFLSTLSDSCLNEQQILNAASLKQIYGINQNPIFDF